MIEAVLTMNPQAVLAEASTNQNSCCAGAVAGAIATAQNGATTAESMDYTTSYDKQSGDSFVGYLAAPFSINIIDRKFVAKMRAEYTLRNLPLP